MSSKKKDYYKILGVPENASEAEIKRAFRRKARELHPDRAGERATRAFQELQEAYDVLRDEEKRASYDRDRKAHEGSIRIWVHRKRDDKPVLHRRCTYPPFRAYLGIIDVYLTPEELKGGTTFRWQPVVEYPCRWCSQGFDFPEGCWMCRGRGSRIRRLTIPVHLPPGLHAGMKIHGEWKDRELGYICFDIHVFRTVN